MNTYKKLSSQEDKAWFMWYYLYAAKSRQSCPTLWDPMDSSPPGSSVPGSLQARILEWVAISFSTYLYEWLRVWAFDQLDMGLRPRPVGLRAVALANYLISLNLHFIICNNVPMF